MGKSFAPLFLTFALLMTAPAARAADWDSALTAADPLTQKLRLWLTVTDTDRDVPVRTLIGFVLANPEWPRLNVFRDRIEKNIDAAALTPAETAAWFAENPPRGAAGADAYLSALLRLGEEARARTALQAFWPEAVLDRAGTETLARRYARLFSAGAHARRADALLAAQRAAETEFLIPFLDLAWQELARARIALIRRSPQAPALLKKVAPELQDNSGLLLDRARWSRIRNDDTHASELLSRGAFRGDEAEAAWKERHILARRAMERRDFARAYRIISGHGLSQGSTEYAQAEWLQGWLALRFLRQPDVAYRHFERFYQAVTSAVSRSRATYWLARASSSLGQEEAAKNWQRLCARFPSTFYGQICREKMGEASTTAFPDDQVPAATAEAFAATEAPRIVRLLQRLDALDYAHPFFMKMLDNAKDRADFILIARLAREVGQLRYAVEANKQMQQKIGEFMFEEGYPLLPALPASEPESPLIHAIVHRESMFDANAESPAGALGMMQLMPGTARHMSGKIGESYSAERLTANPRYNIRLGAAYLQSLIEQYDGFTPLAIAAYNAGPGNVAKWIKTFGDPRNSKADVIDWIEMIPVYETRNYVQRVMESYYIYRLKMFEKPITILGFYLKK